MDLIADIEAGKITLSELITTLAEQKDYAHSKWYQSYSQFTQQLQQTTTFSEENPDADALLKRLWYERGNGIASIKQGVPSADEYQRNLSLFRALTEQIRQHTDQATYQQVTAAMEQAKKEGHLSRMYWSLRNRVFAAFSPKSTTTTVDENAFIKAAEYLNKQFSLGVDLSGDWLEKNHKFKQVMNARLPDIDAHYVNMALWHLYELLLESHNEKKSTATSAENMGKQDELPSQKVYSHSPVNAIYFGPPGTGKTYKLQQRMAKYTSPASSESDEASSLALYKDLQQGPQDAEAIQRFAVVTFHQSYGYEEFIEGIRARSDDNGNITYPIEPGIFLRLCQRAKADPAHRYAIFIDEINRGNISKIFGELISLIEVDKRAGMENAMSVQLSYSGEAFSVPANIDIIGAMNTADRSIALMDTALRRRFDFIEMMPDLSLLSGVKVKGIELEVLLEKLNSRIEALYDREHILGHAFFIPVKKALEAKGEDEAFAQLKTVFQKKIIPLLQEYFFDDWHKIRLVLGDNQKKNDDLQFVIEKPDKLDVLFGSDHGLGRYAQEPKSYALKVFKHDVWNEPQAYRTIYQQEKQDAANE